MRAKAPKGIAVLGTMSGVGKSLLSTLIGYRYRKAGLKVAPFKAHNTSLNAYAVEGGEMAYAQVVQAWMAGSEPEVRMNPILQKPISGSKSERIVLGKSEGLVSLRQRSSLRRKDQLAKVAFKALSELFLENEVVVVEGAGGTAEMNLMPYDFANIGLAKAFDLPVILVGDIERGGIFAQILGTLDLCGIKRQVKGFIVNKFCGNPSFFEEGVKFLEKKTKLPCLGVLPKVEHQLFEEDDPWRNFFQNEGRLQVGVVYYPHMSNFLDFDPLKFEDDLHITLTDDPLVIASCDLVFLPGTRATIKSLQYLRKKGIDKALEKHRGFIFGLCGGLQMLGDSIVDEGVEEKGEFQGLGFIPLHTVFKRKKKTGRISVPSCFDFYRGSVQGFQIRHGESFQANKSILIGQWGNIFGSYLHGIFFDDSFRTAFLNMVRRTRNLKERREQKVLKRMEEEVQRLCRCFEKHLNWDDLLC